MDIQAWKQAVREQADRLAQGIRRRTPGAVYGLLSAASVAPIISAVTQGDYGALGAVFGVVGGVGGNLIANQIQAWRDRSEDELAADLVAKARQDKDWRETLDKLLQTLETPRLVRARLSAADRVWFVETLNRELTQVGSTLRIEGDGNVVVTGDRAITAGGDMTGNLNVTGDNATILIARDTASALVRTLRPNRLSPADLQATTESYLTYLLTRYRYLDFKGMGMADRVPLRLPLEEMYVPLKARIELPRGETWARKMRLAGRQMIEEEVAEVGQRLSEPTSLINLLGPYDGLVILGDPGAGKTTFLKYLALRLAQGQGKALNLANRLPILVPLSAYANAIAHHDVPLHQFLGEYYRGLGVDLPVDHLLETALAQGRALVMFDGLDEVQALTQRSLVVDRVVAFFAYQRQRHNKFILTSRIVGYREVRPTADGLAECTLVDFDEQDIAEFVDKWCQALERAALGASQTTTREAAAEKVELLAAVEHNNSVKQLAANPLLLTILALMKRQGVILPERRVELYDKYVETLLRHWNLARGLDRRAGRDLDVGETLKVLAPLALWMQETSPGRGLVKREAVRRQLVSIYRQRKEPDAERAARQVLADARDYASLLLERGPGEYGFIHLTFQEYLAAVGVAQLGQVVVKPVADLLLEHVDQPTWREVILLTIGYLGIVQQRDQAASEVVDQLIASQAGPPGAAVVLAGEAVADVWPGGVTPRCKDAVVEALLKTLRADTQVQPPTRAAAGDVLAKLGDPRFRADAWYLPDEPWLGFVEIPAGSFWMGEGTERHRVDLLTFYIGRYPVTVAQFKAFVEASGYQPEDPDCLRDPLNRPVRWVSWHEARHYCQWLTETLRGWDQTPEPLARRLRGGGRLTLPSEAEWEKAARGTDGRMYPWGQRPDPNRANYTDSQIGDTSAVGCFPGGVSPYGVEDMAGNVWEWTRSEYRDYPYRPKDDREIIDDKVASRPVRGGGFYYGGDFVRCAYRYGEIYDNRSYRIGFRVAHSGL